MKKLVIFDLDGTLVNSIYDLADSVNAALGRASLPEHTLDEYYSFVGNGIEHLIRTSMGEMGSNDELYKSVRADFDSQYAAHCTDKTVAYEGMPELLGRLADDGFKTAIISNKAEEFIAKIIEKNFHGHIFSAVRGQREGVKRKPSGEAVELVLKELGYEKSECIYVGDSEVDLKTAENAGVDMICVLWGFRSQEYLRELGAERMVKTSQELYEEILRS